MLFLNCNGNEEIASNGSSYLNREEAKQVLLTATLFIKAGVDPENIGVITAYEGQRAYLQSYLETNGQLSSEVYKLIEVASVDAYQGREKEFIIISCVRSSENQGIGFLRDPRRLNVAITRSSRGLVIVGNPKVLARDPLWNNLLLHFQANDCLLDGSMDRNGESLYSSRVMLPRPKFNYHKSGYGRVPLGSQAAEFEGQHEPEYYGRGWGVYADYDSPMVLESAPARNMRGPDSRYDPRYSDTASDSGSYYSQSQASTSNSSRISSVTMSVTDGRGPTSNRSNQSNSRRGKDQFSDTASIASQDLGSVSSYSMSTTSSRR